MEPKKEFIHMSQKVTKVNLPLDHLSPSQIDMYFRCPAQYHFRYILGIKNPPAVNLVDGSCHHRTLDNNNKYKIKTGKDRSDKYLIQRFSDIFSDEAKEIPKIEWKLAETTKDKVINRGRLIQKQYCKLFAPNLTPEFCEEEVRIKVGDVEVLGYIDVGGSYKPPFQKKPTRVVLDYKITGRKKSDDEIQNSVQLSHYGWASLELLKGVSFRNPPHVGFCNLLKTGSCVPVTQTVPFTSQRVKWYRRQVSSVVDAISKGSFPIRNAVGWECSKRFCGYWDRCRGKIQKD